MTLQAGYEPLLEAIRDADIPALDRLLSTNKYSVNTEIPYQSEDGKTYLITPLYWAVKVRQKDVCRYLLQKRADPYLHMVYEYYPLHEACNCGYKEIVEEFIKSGCDLSRTNCDGDTPLHIASMRGHTECIRLLLNAGADYMVRNSKGETPLQAAQYTNQTSLLKLFEIFEKDQYISSHWKPQISGVSAAKLHRPLSGGDYRYSSSTCSTQLYANGSKDDSSVASRYNRRQDITRTHSFSGNRSQQTERHRYKSPLVQNHSAIVHHHRPLANMSHDSQLVLPTQALINDPRRTQTYHDFSESIPRVEEKVASNNLLPSPGDEIEADSSTSVQGLGTKLRVRHMIQYLNQSVVNKFGEGLDSTHSQLLLSVRADLDFGQSEYSAVQQLTGKFCGSAHCRLPSEDGLDSTEYVWGCDYEMVDRQPLHIESGTPTSQYASLLFQIRLLNCDLSKSKEIALLKVIMNIFDLSDKEESVNYHSGNYDDSCNETLILLSLPPHPNIVQLLYHCTAHSRPFERFTRFFAPEDGHASIKMAPRLSLLFLKEHSMTFEKYLLIKKQLQALPPYAIDERIALLFLVQLLLALSHLDQYGVVIGYLTSSDILFSNSYHLRLAGFSHAFDVHDKTPYEVRTSLLKVTAETLLNFSPELSYLNDCSSSSLPDGSSMGSYLGKVNSFAAGRFFLDTFTKESLAHKTPSSFPSLSCFSSNLRNLVKRLVSSSKDDRPTAMEAAICCFVLLFGPSKEDCRTRNDCCQWLITETCHFFLQPSLKGQPMFYNNKDICTKLLFTYLTIVSPDSLWSAVQLIYNISATR